VEKGLRTQARRVLLQQVAPAYHNASGSHKQQILEEFVTATGYVRKYAMWLLNHAEEVLTTTAVLRRKSGPEVEQALVLAWKTLNRICTKTLHSIPAKHHRRTGAGWTCSAQRGTPTSSPLHERGNR
jgi:hypothetical protein